VFLNIHNLVAIRIENASSEAKRLIQCEFGRFRMETLDRPDAHITFVDRINIAGRLVFVGSSAAYDKERFYLHDHAGSLVAFPYETLGNSVGYVECEKDLDLDLFHWGVMRPIIMFNLLSRDSALVHSSSLFHRGIGVLLPAWGFAGKTNLLLRFLKDGAEYISDDWTIVTKDGLMLSFPTSINVLGYNLAEFPELSAYGDWNARVRNFLYKRLATSFWWLQRSGVKFGKWEKRIKSEIWNLNKKIRIPYERMFPKGHVRDKCPIDQVFMLAPSNIDRIRIEDTKPENVARKMAYCLLYERDIVADHYNMFRFAFPERRNSLVEDKEIEERIMYEAFRKAELHILFTPRDCSSIQIFQEIMRHLHS